MLSDTIPVVNLFPCVCVAPHPIYALYIKYFLTSVCSLSVLFVIYMVY